MKLNLARVRVALIVAPHSDDEAIGAYGLIRALTARGAVCHILVVTDGAASHLASRRWPRARLVAQRRRETLQAMRGLGIARGRVRFLGLPDGAMSRVSLCNLAMIDRALRRTARLDLLVGPALDDDHEDHHIVAGALRRARLPGVRRLSYKVWPMPGNGVWALPLGPARAEKLRVVRSYRTQCGGISDDPTGFVIDAGQMAAFTRPIEMFGRA